ncbi:MAG: FKBP-type peptidyl-prolyl cis-trans isomerase [Candidatus Micrarchaeota archaeon]|nr:FKBP-type peptidyl-prolyl cis-trans isomerase [Candidatus Micrarchaeota archaeon]
MVEVGALVKVDYVLKVSGETVDQGKGAVFAVGKKHVVKGFDDALQKAEVGKATQVTIAARDAYGERNAELVRLVSLDIFKRQGVEPVSGMVVELDGMPAKVQSVSGGRVRVDFNHELAGKELSYSFTIIEELKGGLSKVKAIAGQVFLKPEDVECAFDEVSKTAMFNFKPDACTKQGFIQAKNTVIGMTLAFVEEVSAVKISEEYLRKA